MTKRFHHSLCMLRIDKTIRDHLISTSRTNKIEKIIKNSTNNIKKMLREMARKEMFQSISPFKNSLTSREWRLINSV
jgi:hypothetical protein